jgi:hypothetical protein
LQALEVEYGCKLCIGPCTTKEEVPFFKVLFDYLDAETIFVSYFIWDSLSKSDISLTNT